MIWRRLFAFSAIVVVFRTCEGYNVKKPINADSSRVYGLMNDAKNREAMIGKVLESYVKPFKRLSATFPRHDVEIQLEFQRPANQQASNMVQKRPIYRETLKRSKVHPLHERGHPGVDYLAERTANEHYSVPGHNTVEYLPYNNIAGHNTMDHFVGRDIDNYGARKIVGRFGDGFGVHNGMDNFRNQNAMVNFDGRNDMSNLAGHNTGMDNFSSRNSLGNNAGDIAINNFNRNNAVDSFAGPNAMNINYPGMYPMNHGVNNLLGQDTVPVAPIAPLKGKGVPPVARQAETESTTTEAAETTTNVNNNNNNNGQPLSLDDIRQLFDEYAEKIINSKLGNEQQQTGNNQLPQIYIQDNHGEIDESVLSNLDRITSLIKKGVQIHKIDENKQESFLPKHDLNWMKIKVPVR